MVTVLFGELGAMIDDSALAVRDLETLTPSVGPYAEAIPALACLALSSSGPATM
jgi:hypothetical protein